MTGNATYLLRLRLPDQPGALGQVASVLGAAGADIQSIVVVDRAPAYAVDDLVVALPPDRLADSLVTAAASVPGVVVEVVQRHHGRMDPRDELALLDAAATDADPLGVLVDGLPGLLSASYALVLGPAFLRPSFSAPSVPPLAGLAPLGGPTFRPSELMRLAHLANVAAAALTGLMTT